MGKLALNPWIPARDPVDLAVLGKFAEELNEAGAAAARCIIQGIAECEPVTGKPNKEWLEDEIADVLAGVLLTIRRFDLNTRRIEQRRETKLDHLENWHRLILTETANGEAG